jgi:transcriptional regulator with XRE-family HTH domain
MSPVQCREARFLLNWSLLDLADKADLSLETISNFENYSEELTVSVAYMIQSILQQEGINIDEDGKDLIASN